MSSDEVRIANDELKARKTDEPVGKRRARRQRRKSVSSSLKGTKIIAQGKAASAATLGNCKQKSAPEGEPRWF